MTVSAALFKGSRGRGVTGDAHVSCRPVLIFFAHTHKHKRTEHIHTYIHIHPPGFSEEFCVTDQTRLSVLIGHECVCVSGSCHVYVHVSFLIGLVSW